MMTVQQAPVRSAAAMKPVCRSRWQRLLAAGLALSMATASWAQAVPSTGSVASSATTLVPTESFMATPAEARQLLEAQARLLELLKREDLAAALTQRGIDIVEAQARVAALTLEQVKALSDQLDKLPAGSSEIISTVLFVFVLLLITDILGFTKVFPFTRSVR